MKGPRTGRLWLQGLVFTGIIVLLLAMLVSADDAYEENDDKDNAAQVDYGKYDILYCEDDDWYKILLDQDSDLTVTISFDGDVSDLDMQLYDEEDNLLDSSAQSEGNEEEVSVGGLDAGWYYIHVYPWEVQGDGEYSMDIKDEYNPPEGTINVDQQITDGDDDNTLNDCTFLATVKGEAVSSVTITVYNSVGGQTAQGKTDGNGLWLHKNMTNDDYSWDAEFDDEPLEDEGTFDVAVDVREVQGFAQIKNEDLDTNYNDVYFVAYDEEMIGNIEGVECVLYWASNDTLYDEGKTDENGQYRVYNLPEDAFTFTTTYEDDEYNTGWLYSYGRASGGGDTNEWFERWDYDTKDTGTDGKDDTIYINFNPDTEAVEMEVEVDISVYHDGDYYDGFWEYYDITGEDEDWFTLNWTSDMDGEYDFEVVLYDDEYYEEDFFRIENVYLEAAEGNEKTYLKGYVKEGDTRAEDDPIQGAEVNLDGDLNYRATTDEEGYYFIECEPGDYEIVIDHGDYETHEDTIVIAPEENWYNASLITKAMGWVNGTVTDKDSGEALDTARVRLRNQDGGAEDKVYTDSEGFYSFHVAAGDYDIYLDMDDYEDIEDEVTVERDDELTRDYEMIPEVPTGEVYGDIKDKKSNDNLGDVTVTFTEQGGGDSFEATTDSEGYYEIDLPEGDYDIKVEHDDYQTKTDTITVKEDDEIDRSYKLDPKEGRLYGEVMDTVSDEGVKGAKITATEKESRTDPYTDDTDTDSEGEYELYLPPGDYEVKVEHDDYHSQTFDVTIEKEVDEELNVDFEPRTQEGTMKGRVTAKSSGDPLEGVTITLTDSTRSGYEAKTDEYGDYSLDVPTGDYDITVEHTSYQTINDEITVEYKEEHTKDYEMEKESDKKLSISTDAPDEMDAGDEIEIVITVIEEGSSNPVEGAELTLSHTGPADLAVNPGDSLTDANGEYTVLVNADDIENDGSVTLTIKAEKDDHQDDTIELTIIIKGKPGETVLGPEEGNLDNGASYFVKAGVDGSGSLDVSVANNPDPQDNKAMGVYLDISFTGDEDDINWVYIAVNYDEVPEGLTPSELKIYYWDDDDGDWVEAEDTGVDISGKFVWANITHLTIFAPRDVTGAVVDQYEFSVTGATQKTVLAGGEASYTLNIENTGDIDDNYVIELSGTRDDWGSLEFATLDLAAGQDDELTVTVTVPSSITAETYSLDITVSSVGDSSLVETLTLEVTVQDDGSNTGDDGGEDDSPGFAGAFLLVALGTLALVKRKRH